MNFYILGPLFYRTPLTIPFQSLLKCAPQLLLALFKLVQFLNLKIDNNESGLFRVVLSGRIVRDPGSLNGLPLASY